MLRGAIYGKFTACVVSDCVFIYFLSYLFVRCDYDEHDCYCFIDSILILEITRKSRRAKLEAYFARKEAELAAEEAAKTDVLMEDTRENIVDKTVSKNDIK